MGQQILQHSQLVVSLLVYRDLDLVTSRGERNDLALRRKDKRDELLDDLLGWLKATKARPIKLPRFHSQQLSSVNRRPELLSLCPHQ